MYTKKIDIENLLRLEFFCAYAKITKSIYLGVMRMDDRRKLTGHPWHIRYLKMDENDTRRDKRRCIHFHENYCQKNFTNCVGSSHCPFYKDLREGRGAEIRGAEIREAEVRRESSVKIEELLRKIFEEK